jgi:type IV secretory pathway VirB10-like protein
MRAFRLVNFGIFATLIASSAILYAQDEKPQENKPRQEEPRQQAEPSREARPESRQDEMKPPRQDEAKPARPDRQERSQEQRQGEKTSREETRPAQPEPSRPEAGRQESGRQESGRQEAGQQQEHARPTGRSGRIPDDRFRAQFGRSHPFRAQRPVIVDGQPRFEYGDYTFVLVDPWPEDWAYTDDCYIDDVDGDYFLYDLLHPGMRIALFVMM